MGRSKKQQTEVEKLEADNKELKLIVRSLERQLRKQSKVYKPEHSKEKMMHEDYAEKNTCQECGKGNIIETDLGPRKLIHCTICDFKKALKK